MKYLILDGLFATDIHYKLVKVVKKSAPLFWTPKKRSVEVKMVVLRLTHRLLNCKGKVGKVIVYFTWKNKDEEVSCKVDAAFVECWLKANGTTNFFAMFRPIYRESISLYASIYYSWWKVSPPYNICNKAAVEAVG